MSRILLAGLMAAALAGPLAWSEDADRDEGARPISGTWHKGPAIGGRMYVKGSRIVIFGERGIGSVTGGVLTGNADYLIDEERINLAEDKENGSFHGTITIHNASGSTIVLRMHGKTTGIEAEHPELPVHVTGTWSVESAVGLHNGLRGHGTFEAEENFITGDTQGTFTGRIR